MGRKLDFCPKFAPVDLYRGAGTSIPQPGEAIRTRGERMAAAGGIGVGGGDLDLKFESHHK